MKIKPALTIRQQQKLSPRLYQSLKILRLNSADLMELIHRELNENPVLEIPEPADFDMKADASRELWQDLAGANRDRQDRGGRTATAAPVNPAELAASPITLADHLELQLDLERLRPERHRLGLAIIGSLDDEGYLRDDIADIAAAAGRPAAEAAAVLAVIQGFDPPGVAARGLEECLQIQLKQLGAGRVAREIAAGHLDALARGASGEIARKLKTSASQVERAAALIRSLNPAPGSIFDTGPPPAAVIPDVYVRKSGDEIEVLANRELLPPLVTNPLYEKMAAAGGQEAAAYLKTKLADAKRLIRDVNDRRATVTAVARTVAAAQPGFFERGPAGLAPLSLEDIAARLLVHPSTISRAILGKYMSTPYGVFELKYFFSAGYETAGGPLAATAVKKRLGELISGEDSRRPLSDQKLSEILKRDGINISRRTVAKYREAAAIPDSRRRKTA